MSGVISTIGAAWGRAAQVAAARPLPFLAATLALAGTDFLLWQMGVFDGIKGRDADRALLATFLIGKLLIILIWLLASFRLAADSWAGSVLRLDKKQGLWIGGLFLFMPVALAFRVALTKIAAILMAPLGPDPRIISLGGIALYLMTIMYFQMRFAPALIGVLLGDGEASLRWSWRAMKGKVGAAIAAIVGMMLPLFAIHYGISLYWLPQSSVARGAVLLFDGAVMAFLMLASSAAYIAIYRLAKGDNPGSALPSAALV
ncbi:hypothetical protein IC614_01945 [Allosphingosinicella flava]|uniref:Uncharacterized protein n=1 Tax=Allosphingosinicella flava TaxID=2771430 RepID=A0A7T2GKD2_9SPHN|nr:hypothetical protein [Sphingosinicella flava]QPQ55397.1 hypothetical protein IC614_01945 [Sphingosinicella flava]